MHIFRLLQCLCQQLPVGSRCRPGAVDSQQISQCVTRVSSPPRNLRRNSCVFIIIVIISTNNRQRFWVPKNISKKIQHTVNIPSFWVQDAGFPHLPYPHFPACYDCPTRWRPSSWLRPPFAAPEAGELGTSHHGYTLKMSMVTIFYSKKIDINYDSTPKKNKMRQRSVCGACCFFVGSSCLSIRTTIKEKEQFQWGLASLSVTSIFCAKKEGNRTIGPQRLLRLGQLAMRCIHMARWTFGKVSSDIWFGTTRPSTEENHGRNLDMTLRQPFEVLLESF